MTDPTLDPNHEPWMRQALDLARHAASMGEVPVGAVIVKDGIIVGRGYNRRETDLCATSHAEITAIREACQTLKAWRLSGCVLYVTLEPCVMCAGAIHQARIEHVIFGAYDPKAGATGSLYKIHEDTRLNHRFLVQGEVLGDESRLLLREFFKARRSKPATER